MLGRFVEIKKSESKAFLLIYCGVTMPVVASIVAIVVA